MECFRLQRATTELIQPRVLEPKGLDREFSDTKFNQQQWNSSSEEEPKELV
jgi:hypothetical protein